MIADARSPRRARLSALSRPAIEGPASAPHGEHAVALDSSSVRRTRPCLQRVIAPLRSAHRGREVSLFGVPV